MQFRIVAAALVLTALSVHVEPAVAQDAYPSRAVRILLSFPPGSSPDIRTRIIANQLTALWGKQVIVENRPGAGGVLSVQALLATPADGYSLLGSAASLFTILPAQKDKLTFDVNRDIVPVALTGSEGMVFAVSPKLGVNTLAEFIALAKAQPDKLVIGTNPAGSLPHLAAQLFVKLSKAPVIVVPTTGGTNEAIREILGGRAHVVIESRPAIKAHLESGDLKPLAIMTPERLAAIPDLPAAAETVPGLAAIGWSGIFARQGTPDAVIQRLSESVRQAMDVPETKARLEQIGTPYRPLFTADFVRFIELEQKLWWPIVKETAPN